MTLCGNGRDGPGDCLVGWWTFSEAHALCRVMEVQGRYYSMTPNSCVLALYVGHVRSLRSSLDAIGSSQAFAERPRG